MPPTKMTAEEYRKKYGTEPISQSTGPQRMTVDEFESAYGSKPIIGSPLEGAVEVAMQMGSGAIIEPFAGVTGAVAGVAHQSPEVAAGVVEAVREQGTYQPRTETGKRYSRNIADALSPVGEALESIGETFGQAGARGLEPFGLEAEGYALGKTAPTAAAIATGGIGGGATANVLKRMPGAARSRQARIDKKVRDEMVYQGMDPDMVNMFREAAPTDKNAMREMVDIVERGLKQPDFEITNPYSTPAGKNVKRQYDFVDKKRREAGKKLDEAAKRLKGQPIDVAPAIDNFLSSLDDMGIRFNEKTGRVSFPGSDIEKLSGLEKTVTDLVDVLRMDHLPSGVAPTAYDAHRIKRWIDNNVSYSKRQEGMTAQVEILMKNLRHDLDTALDGRFSDYDKWNTVYRETKEATQAIQDGTVSSIDVAAPNVERALGIETRKLLSNYASGSAQMNALDLLQSVANKYGGNFDDNLLHQVMFVQQLRAAFPRLEARKRTFAAESGGLKSQDVRDPKGAVVDRALDAGIEMVRGKRDEEALLKALKRLLSEPKPAPQRTAGPPAPRR